MEQPSFIGAVFGTAWLIGGIGTLLIYWFIEHSKLCVGNSDEAL